MNVGIIGRILLASEVRGTQKYGRVRECSNYQVFECVIMPLLLIVTVTPPPPPPPPSSNSRYVNGELPTYETFFDPVLQKYLEKAHTSSGNIKDFAVKDMHEATAVFTNKRVFRVN